MLRFSFRSIQGTMPKGDAKWNDDGVIELGIELIVALLLLLLLPLFVGVVIGGMDGVFLPASQTVSAGAGIKPVYGVPVNVRLSLLGTIKGVVFSGGGCMFEIRGCP